MCSNIFFHHSQLLLSLQSRCKTSFFRKLLQIFTSPVFRVVSFAATVVRPCWNIRRQRKSWYFKTFHWLISHSAHRNNQLWLMLLKFESTLSKRRSTLSLKNESTWPQKLFEAPEVTFGDFVPDKFPVFRFRISGAVFFGGARSLFSKKKIIHPVFLMSVLLDLSRDLFCNFKNSF